AAASAPARRGGRAGPAISPPTGRSPRRRWSPPLRARGAAPGRAAAARRGGAARPSVGRGHRHGGDAREEPADLAPAPAGVDAREQLAGARAEVEAWIVLLVDRHAVAQHADVGVLARQPVRELLPAGAGVARAPDRGLAIR